MKNRIQFLLKVLLIIMLLFLCFFNSKSFANTDEDIDLAINEEKGGLFESTIALAIGGIAKAVFNIASSDTIHLGFKNYDELIFNKNTNIMAPFDNDTWNKIMSWYKIFTLMAFVPIMIGSLVVAYKFIIAGTSIQKRNDAKESFMRLFFGGIAIAMAPFFVKFLLFINANLVSSLVKISTGGLDSLLGNGVFTQIKTGSAIATALVICLFAYLYVKINIKFIIRKFTLIVFTIFTPLAAGLWIINKNVTAASIWFGQIMINVFMQFIYSFLFLVYMSFTAVSDGWAVSLLWAMMILPLGDALLNMLQNLVSRIAGVNNEEISNRGIGMGAVMAHTVHSVGAQFMSNNNSNNNVNGSKSEEKNSNGIISRISKISSKNQIGKKEDISNNNTTTNTNSRVENKNINSNNNSANNKGKISLYGLGKGIMNTGMYMAEGRNYSNNINGNRRSYGMNMRKNERDANVTNSLMQEKSQKDEKSNK